MRNNKNKVAILYFDFTKAFDTVPHLSLVAKLKSYGTADSLLSWIKSFLSHRKQVVNIGSVYSSPRES